PYLPVPDRLAVDHRGIPYSPDINVTKCSPVSDLSRYRVFAPYYIWQFSRVAHGQYLRLYYYTLSPADINTLRSFISEWNTDPCTPVELNKYIIHTFRCTPPSRSNGVTLTSCIFEANVVDANLYFFSPDYLRYFKVGIFNPDKIMVSADLNTHYVDVSHPAGITVQVYNGTDTNIPFSISLNLPSQFYSIDNPGFYLIPHQSGGARITIYALPSKQYSLELNIYAAGTLLKRYTYTLYFPHEFNESLCINNRLYGYFPGYGYRLVRVCPYGCDEKGHACAPPFWVKNQRLITLVGAGLVGELYSEAVAAYLSPVVSSPLSLLGLSVLAFLSVLAGWYIAQDLYDNHPNCPAASWAPLMAVLLPLLIGGIETLLLLGALYIFCSLKGN
ncbi:MAG: hypothetical protein GXO39_01630, partial [Thermotogae bacterium]|nr:hypothetical protein [Thermotogota bacterium]